MVTPHLSTSQHFSHLNLSGLSQGPDCIKTVILQPETSLDTVVDQLSKMFDGYIQYYAHYPQMSHFSPYSGEEIATLAEHLKKKLREISSSHSQVVFLILNGSLFRSCNSLFWLQSNINTDDLEPDHDLRKLIESFPHHNKNTLKSYVEKWRTGNVFDFDGLINEILMNVEPEDQPER